MTDATFERVPGGKGANQAVAAARMGARVRFVGRIGQDDLVLRSMEDAGIDTSGVLFGELQQLVNSPESFVEFENYRGETARAEWDEALGYVLEWNAERKRVTEQGLMDWVRKFLCPENR